MLNRDSEILEISHDQPSNDVSILLGTSNILTASRKNRVMVRRIIIHPNYSQYNLQQSKFSDVGILLIKPYFKIFKRLIFNHLILNWKKIRFFEINCNLGFIV